MFARRFGIAGMLFQQGGQKRVRLRKIRVQGNGGTQGLGRALVFFHSRQRAPEQVMRQGILVSPLQRFES